MSFLESQPSRSAARFVGNLLGTPPDRRLLPESVWLAIHEAVSHSEERLSDHRDQWGNWEWSFGGALKKGGLVEPWLDNMVIRELRRTGETPRPIWKDGAPFALCLTHDVDHVTAVPGAAVQLRALRPRHGTPWERAIRAARATTRAVRNLRATRPDPHWCFERWIDLERSFHFNSSFYFAAERVKDPHEWDCLFEYRDQVEFRKQRMTVAEMMRLMRAEGCEVSIHGSIGSALDSELLIGQKRRIESILGEPVLTTRQHFLRYDIAVTPGIQWKANLIADSTLGFNRACGFRAGTSFPYWVTSDSGKQVLEVPMHIMDGALFTRNAMELSEQMACSYCTEVLNAVEKVGGCLTLNWHPHSIMNPVWWRTYEYLLKEASRRGAWGCSCAELAEYWISRERMIFQ